MIKDRERESEKIIAEALLSYLDTSKSLSRRLDNLESQRADLDDLDELVEAIHAIRGFVKVVKILVVVVSSSSALIIFLYGIHDWLSKNGM